MRRTRTAIAGLAAICAAFVLPAVASADCSLSAASDDYLSGGTTQTFSGHFDPNLNGKFVQLPFHVDSGTRGMRIRYCFAKSDPADDGPTLDLGVYGARPAGETSWSQDERRGWSGSALRTVGIGENGYTDETTYNASRKAYVPGFTTRAFKPGPIDAGEWAVELGAGWIDPDGAGVDWKVEVVTSPDSNWSNAPFTPDPYSSYVADADPGWYTGDLHAHGEMEPGNAPMRQTFDLGFKPLAQGGTGLDFMTIVDHNNDNSRSVLGGYTGDYPGKLIIPGVEVTTYDGHANAQYSNQFADFRFSDVYRWDDDDNDDAETADELSLVRPSIDPSSQFQRILDGDGFTQVNHPETLKSAPAACRGCAWTYSDERTGWGKVSALEIQNGAAAFPANQPTPPSAMNPFTLDAITLYERLLAAGFHIAAVGSSDDHQGGGATGPTDSEVGRGATVVHADQLSPGAIVAAVKAGHTYVKPFGADAPDVDLTASGPGTGTALPGDSVTSSSLDIKIDVKGAASAVRPGPYTLKLLQDGIEVGSVPVTGDDFSHTFTVTETGRYSFELTRILTGTNVGIEAYSTPVWFTYKKPDVTPQPPSNAFRFGAFKANRKNGTGTLKVRVASPGRVKLTGKGIAAASARVKAKNQTVTLRIRPKAALKKRLKKRGVASVRLRVTNAPTGGKALSKSKTVKLRAKKAKKHRRR
ncbi:MAG: CehA/McbA family metallohydrolase [Solirubrobacterales bacterium]|nr:CehA/McbA family metallohydrolase [Solirubrobacterales bacterium]